MEKKREQEKKMETRKNIHFNEMIGELKEKALYKIKEWQKNGKHVEVVESSRQKLVSPYETQLRLIEKEKFMRNKKWID